MWRYAIAFGFDGTAYHGWQIQPNGMSVQQKLQEALGLVLRKDILVVGAGRTDAGVHARKMTAHFDLDEEIACEQLAYRLNRVLPKDIAVYDVKRVNEDFHARFSAVKRTYHYYIHLRKDPFRRHYSYELHACPDFKLMNTAAAYLLETRDFAAFCKSKSDAKTTICRVMAARWIQETEHCWYFEIAADRFLRNMVRAVVGTLLDVGRHRITLEEFRKIVASGSRSAAGESVPGNALFLEDVEY